MKIDQAMKMTRRACALGSVSICLIAGGSVTAASAPTMVQSEAAQNANERFWSTLHGADYAAYPKALAAVETALAEVPDDPVQNARLGWLHMWRLSEAESFGVTPQEEAADLRAARQSFKRAVELAPHEARYLGFYAATQMIESAVDADAAGSLRAEATLASAIRMWPEFNLFTAGYIHSSEPYDSPEYAIAMKRMWGNLDVCAGRRVSRERPEFAQYLSIETHVGPKRACWNSPIAPHNFEGFFMNFGDMLVKNGDVAAARAMYANARLSTDYADWTYRNVLEQRIIDAEANVALFRESAQSQAGKAQIMVQSEISCMACHRR